MRRVVIVSDGKRGHENQSRVLARILSDDEPLLMLLREGVRNGGVNEALLRLRLRIGGGRSALSQQEASRMFAAFLRPENSDAFRAFAEEFKERAAQPQIFVVSTGTPPATFNLVATRMLAATSIVSMRPSLLPLTLFDLAVLPQHDMPDRGLQGNVLVTPLALSYHDELRASLMARELLRDNGLEENKEYWGVAIGGPSKSCPWVGDRILDELAALHGLARGQEARLLVTTSRRTPAHVMSWLKSHYANSEFVPYMLDAAQDPTNPLPAFYEICRRMFISMDSFSMLSEAVQAGHQPLVLRVRVGAAEGKLGRALTRLRERNLIVLQDNGSELAESIAAAAKERRPVNVWFEKLATDVRGALGA
jgi:mitochondrial fission protein ELM1